jgi:hypothetical protein
MIFDGGDTGDDGRMDDWNQAQTSLPALSALLPHQPGVGVRWASSSRVLSLLPSVLDNEDIT